MTSSTLSKLFIIIALMVLSSCQNRPKPNLSPEETARYLEKGKTIVQESFKALSGQLAAAMQNGGVQNAVSYCNLKANPITDSLSRAYNVTISRVTLRPRNQSNLADSNDSDILGDYLKVLSAGEAMQPFVQSTSRDDIVFYAPITIISPLCLKCHGEVGSDISIEDYELIGSLYPEDQATGYSMQELRGLWKVEFH